MTKAKSPPSIRRYTNLAQALFILKHRKIVLMNPSSWDDQNDSFYLQQYKAKKGAKAVSALCFARGAETYHHWSIFSGGTDGVCISFNRNKLVNSLFPRDNIRCESVRYKNFSDMEKDETCVDDLPFIKRKGYAAEKEFRILHTDLLDESNYPQFTFDLNAITRITVSPWLVKDYYPEVKAVIKNTNIPSNIPIYRSTLIGNQTWQRFAREVKK